jgi:hypothetical protein
MDGPVRVPAAHLTSVLCQASTACKQLLFVVFCVPVYALESVAVVAQVAVARKIGAATAVCSCVERTVPTPLQW